MALMSLADVCSSLTSGAWSFLAAAGAVALERLLGAVELPLPVELPGLLQLPAVEGLLGLLGLHQAAKDLPLVEVEVLHFLIDPPAEEFADRHPLRQDFQRPLVQGFAGQVLVPDGQHGSSHGKIPLLRNWESRDEANPGTAFLQAWQEPV
jgi:hypothetical protein